MYSLFSMKLEAEKTIYQMITACIHNEEKKTSCDKTTSTMATLSNGSWLSGPIRKFNTQRRFELKGKDLDCKSIAFSILLYVWTKILLKLPSYDVTLCQVFAKHGHIHAGLWSAFALRYSRKTKFRSPGLPTGGSFVALYYVCVRILRGG